MPPEEWNNMAVKTAKIFDHPLKFLTCEGSVNKGKGRVAIADTGTYRVLTRGEKQRQLELTGRTLKGKFQLLPVKEAR